MLLYSESALTVSVSLTAEDFYVRAHAEVYEQMLSVLARTHQVDMINLRASCAGKPLVVEYLDQVLAQGYGYLTGLSLDDAVNTLRELSATRRFTQACEQALAWASDPRSDMTPAEAVDRGSAEIARALANRGERARGASIDELFRPIADDLIALHEGKGVAKRAYIPAPLPELESLLNGLKPGQSIVVAARPGSGKTVLGLMCAEAAIKFGARAVVYSFEMSKEELAERLLANRSSVDSKTINRRCFNRDEIGRAFAGMNSYIGQKLWIVDAHRWNIDHVSRDARREHTRDPVGIIIIDYLQLIEPRTRGKDNNRERDISEISRECKLLAKELGLPVVLLSQMNRKVETRESGEPQLSDLRESGSIEQDADVVLFLTVDQNSQDSKMYLRKQRGGQLGVFSVKFEGKYARFKSHDGYA